MTGRIAQTNKSISLSTHVLKRGFIVSDNAINLECTVRDASETGATLQLVATFGIPIYCDLVIGERRRLCRVQWRTSTNIGVSSSSRFIAAGL